MLKKPLQQPPKKLKRPPYKLRRPPIFTFLFVAMAVGSVVALILQAEGVLLLELIVVSCLLLERVEVLVSLLAPTRLLPRVSDFAVSFALVRLVVVVWL